MQYLIKNPESDFRTINLPTSKSVSHRAMILASMNEQKSIIKSVLDAEDTNLTYEALKTMGCQIEAEGRDFTFNASIGNSGGGEIYLANSGSSMRFLLPLAPMAGNSLKLYGSERLHERPAVQMLEALKLMGAKFESNNNFLPVTFESTGLTGGTIKFDKLPSSQVVSGLMMAAPKMNDAIEIVLPKDVPSLPYITMTYKMMKNFGFNLQWEKNVITSENKMLNTDLNFTVEKDMSAASYWITFALINEIPVLLKDVTLPSLQGDEFIFEIAKMAGGKITETEKGIEISGSISKSFDVDCGDTPDLVPAIAVLAMFAPEVCSISNIEHLRVKECDRIEAIQANIKTLGGKSDYENDVMKIYPQKKYNGGLIEVYNDHRIAMCFAIAGSRIENVIIDNPLCVGKSYPNFWIDYRSWIKK